MDQEKAPELFRYLFRFRYVETDSLTGNDHNPGRCIVEADGIEMALDKFYDTTAAEKKIVTRIWNIEILGKGRRPL